MFDNVTPLISIITVSLNEYRTIEKTIKSVIRQGVDQIEYIIIDGGSEDGTIDIIRDYEDKISYWESKPDRGIYHAMNKGIDISNGHIIGILNSGDSYCKDTFTIVIDAFKSDNHPQIVFGDVIMCNQNQDKLYTNSVKKRLFNDGWMPHPAVFVKRKVYEEFGCFDLKLRISADYDFMLRINSKTRMLYVERPLAIMQMIGVSTTHYLLKANEDYYAREKNGMPFKKNILLTALSVFSPILSNLLRVVFGFPEFRFENTKFLSWVRKNLSVSINNN